VQETGSRSSYIVDTILTTAGLSAAKNDDMREHYQ